MVEDIEDYAKEPENGLIRYGPEVVYHIRKLYKLEKKEDREKAIAIIDEWIKSQDHFMKKDYRKGYIERCLITCEGSIEKTKRQIDKMCTFRTIMPHFFQLSNIREHYYSTMFSERGYGVILPKLTKQYHRVFIIRAKPNAVMNTAEFSLMLKFFFYCVEYFKSHDYCLGFHLIFDIFDTKLSNIVPSVNLIELQQIIPILKLGYGSKLKGLYYISNSKVIEMFLKILKPVFSTKLQSRIHGLTDRKSLGDFIDIDILPEEYGGPEDTLPNLHELGLECISAPYVEEYVEEMKKGTIDESKRPIDVYNNEYMGIPGTFRTLSLD